jgi:hypothetical protein
LKDVLNVRSIWFFVGVALAACSHLNPGLESGDAQAGPPKSNSAARASTAAGRVVLGTIVLADAKLVVLATGHGPRYQVFDASGRLNSDNIDEQELAVRHPGIYEIYRSAYARSANQPYLDASR